jgi:PKD repeat protein
MEINKARFDCCKFILVMIQISLFCVNLLAQSEFNIVDPKCFLYSNIALDNEIFYVVGDFWNDQKRSVSVIKYNNANEIIYDTITNNSDFSSSARIGFKNDKIYITAVFSSLPPFDSESKDILGVSYNLNLNKLWTNLYGGTQVDQPYALLVKDSSLYLMNTTNSFGAGNGDFYLIKTDLEGNVLWEKTYGSDKNEIGFSITETQDGNLLISGHRRIEGINWNIYLVLVDADGNVLWEKDYGGNLNDYAGLATATYDHSFIVYRNVNDGNNGPTVGYVEKLDGNGNLIWSKAFPYNTLSSFSWAKAVENSDGTIITTAVVRNELNRAIAKIYKLDPSGNILWTKEYFTRPDAGQYIYDVKAMEDGGYVMCGSAFPPDTNVQHGWLLRTNCFGEEGVQHPITTDACEQYDCSQFPITAYFEADVLSVDLADGGVVNFNNASQNTTSRVWSFGDGQIQYSAANLTHTFTQEGIYDVQLIVYHAKCSDTFSLQIEVTNTANITTNKALEELVRYYPNPNNGTFTLENNTNQAVQCEILDAMGKKIAANTYQSGQFVVNLTVPAGIYFIKTSQNGSELIQKMVVR